MKIMKVDHYEEMSQEAAKLVKEKIKANPKATLGLATGGTPVGMYEQLIKEYKEGSLSFRHVKTINLDEYVGLTAGDENSYRAYMNNLFFKHIDIPNESTFLPNGDADDLQKECEYYEETIKSIGGVDLQILGIGGNGHIAFNEPGTPFTSRTHVVKLASATREANARYFDDEEDVPEYAVTMGIETILESKEIVLLASGENKAEALRELVEGEKDEANPSTALQGHPNLTIIADRQACKKLGEQSFTKEQ
ncbi:glucosamine-6-phosphate deaminase [Texcoconibacillus texcoconensis]|uniref:Glucosamine-6-phosphate deaminase n=1 Tax=Texcoconibacillus texcoconensis TaxID=1095777 RepID=A0A840QTN5_9BACI|nr:glucosamine-6-phosphate deaminase [Texcoconibacillus texcoconensis]MBB5174710.1 glucosamine-6-phosphate deaminase [Texcoconibacillus texcoconensis]